MIGGAFVALVLISNIAAQKLFQFGPATFSAAILVFPLSYVIGDVLTEVYGFKRTRRIIYTGLAANLVMAAVLQIAIYLPPAQGWPLQEQFAAVHSLVPRIVLASVVAYLVGELANSVVMSRLKIRMKGRHLWVRTIGSTVVGQGLDTALFVVIAFAGVFPNDILVMAFVSGWIFKVVYEAAVTPLTYMAVGKMKQLEGVDFFDEIGSQGA